MNWRLVLKVTGALTALSLFVVSVLLFGFCEFQFEQPLLINDLGEFGPVMAMQQEIHFKIEGEASQRLKMLGATCALMGALILGACLLTKDKTEGDESSTP